VEIGLRYIYGIGPHLSLLVLNQAGVNPDTRVKDLTEDEVARINTVIQGSEMKVEGDLRREIQLNIKRLMDINCYRGVRHYRKLPVHGQRTRTNARTRKGPRRTVAGKKK
jgi:small subunit ribosomal protein S13